MAEMIRRDRFLYHDFGSPSPSPTRSPSPMTDDQLLEIAGIYQNLDRLCGMPLTEVIEELFESDNNDAEDDESDQTEDGSDMIDNQSNSLNAGDNSGENAFDGFMMNTI